MMAECVGGDNEVGLGLGPSECWRVLREITAVVSLASSPVLELIANGGFGGVRGIQAVSIPFPPV